MNQRLSTIALASALCIAGPAGADPLPSFDADDSGTSVSGLSSGAYMAGQFHVAFSGSLVGAGMVAGGLYDCAEGSVAFALQRCMETNLGDPDPAASLARARGFAARGAIDPLAGLEGDRVYVFTGTEDHTVAPEVVLQVPDFYRLAGVPAGQIALVDDRPAGHAFVTESEGSACGLSETPFLSDCDYDQAGAILTQIYGALAPAGVLAGRLVGFDQSEFLADPTRHGMATTGFLYVPPACEHGGCRVHVVFHGCRQSAELVGDAVTSRAGFNRWADANRLLVLYPQAHETGLNPRSCWDWWGYDDAAYATRSGRQMAAVKAMVDRLQGLTQPVADATCAQFRGMNLGHWRAGRARVCDWWFFCAVGSGERLGLAAGNSTLYEHPAGSFSTASCAA
jgi:poly(3-hydroxybutyrate) depolymerase